MADDEANQAQRVSNLARIRENQRRSRARRKEYLQELEAKYRTCEQLGVEASAEIQAAARKVVEENRRLRLLLIQKGVSEAEIDDGLLYGSTDNVESSAAAAALEIMLTTRRECLPGAGGGCGGGSNDNPSQRQSQGRTLPPPMQQNSQPSRGPSKPEILPTPLHRNASGYSSSSSTSQTPNHANLPQRFAASPMAGATPHQPNATNFDAHFDDPDGNFPWSQLYEDPSMLHDNAAMGTTSEFSSCYAAADAIRTIKPDLGYELEMELGCADGKDCNVSNSQIFSLMDHYSKNQP